MTLKDQDGKMCALGFDEKLIYSVYGDHLTRKKIASTERQI